MRTNLSIWLFAACGLMVLSGWARAQIELEHIDFDRQVAPLLATHCLECHAGSTPEAALNLSSAAFLARGGDSGPVIVPGNVEQSLLWQRIAADEMPPEHPLNEGQKAIFKRWLQAGAAWGSAPIDAFAATTDKRGGRDWWSLQPLGSFEPPSLNDHQANDWVRNPIDRFVLRRLRQSNLQPTHQADPRSLVRRLYFDLIGLPPSPETVAQFVDDPSEAAYQQLVDHLLASQHYGQRWARHWLDVVRFGESDGFERNTPRENAWPYRDWVIDAFNADMPYDEFVRLQLIGDRLAGNLQGAAATGFWVAGVHNTVVGGSQRMKQLARQDELEEVLAVVGQTFLGLTINCARCHDHKFDPITQQEYYQLASAISGLGYGQRVEQSAADRIAIRQFDQQIAALDDQLSQLRQIAEQLLANRSTHASQPEPSTNHLPQPIALWEFDHDLRDSRGELHGIAQGTARLEQGALVLDGSGFVETPVLATPIREKTLEAVVQLEDLTQAGGAAISLQTLDGGLFDAIVFGERESQRWMAGSNGFVRSDSFAGSLETEAASRPVHIAIVYQSDGTITAYRDGVAYGDSTRLSSVQDFASNSSQVLFGLRHKPPGGNRFLKARVHRAALYDRALSAEEVQQSAQASEVVDESELLLVLNETQRSDWRQWRLERQQLAEARSRLNTQANQTLYTLTPGAGEEIRLLLRGDPDYAQQVVAPAATAAIAGLSADFGLQSDAPESERRRALADWITAADNPLFSRVMVNRMWHHHFGTGIVETPNDLGFNGGRPSHPELLDYLARQFRDSGYRLKPLHRLIVSSSTYRQASTGLSDSARERGESLDMQNRLLWRGAERRLEAESLRDAMLQIAGILNEQTAGPGYKDVSVTENNGTTYYEPLDVVGADYWRRTIYRFSPRGGRSALLDSFDCPDPATSAPRRAVSTTPLQALSLLNNALVLRTAEAFAQRVEAEVDDPQQQVQRAWQLAVARQPNESELELSMQLTQRHGLAALCRGLFNAHEFVLIE